MLVAGPLSEEPSVFKTEHAVSCMAIVPERNMLCCGTIRGHILQFDCATGVPADR